MAAVTGRSDKEASGYGASDGDVSSTASRSGIASPLLDDDDGDAEPAPVEVEGDVAREPDEEEEEDDDDEEEEEEVFIVSIDTVSVMYDIQVMQSVNSKKQSSQMDTAPSSLDRATLFQSSFTLAA